MPSMIRTTTLLRQHLPLRQRASLPISRSFSIRATPALAFPRKNTMDKDSMDTNPTEYSKSGGDPETAQLDTAFDGNTTRPEEQGKQAAAESGGSGNNPLDSSPQNHEISQPRDQKEGGAERSPNESSGGRKSSGGGSPMKEGGSPGKEKSGSGGAGGNA